VQLPPPCGLAKSAIYISTEAALSTSRLHQLLQTHPKLNTLPEGRKPSLSQVLAIRTPDLESQDHILRYQVPVAIQRHNVGLIVIDSIASNYRAEFDARSKDGTASPVRRPGAQAMAERRTQLVQLGLYLRDLARRENVAIILSNQVADRFDPTTPYLPPDQPELRTSDPLTLDHQQRWFTGWGDLKGDYTQTSLKTPSLGLVWTNQISARVTLIMEPHNHSHGKSRRRWLRVVFASWAAQTPGRGVEYEITAEGVFVVKAQENDHENST
jgi:DNA repair protein RAD57